VTLARFGLPRRGPVPPRPRNRRRLHGPWRASQGRPQRLERPPGSSCLVPARSGHTPRRARTQDVLRHRTVGGPGHELRDVPRSGPPLRREQQLHHRRGARKPSGSLRSPQHPSVLYLKFVRRFHLRWEDDADLPEASAGFFWDGRSDSITSLVKQPSPQSERNGKSRPGRDCQTPRGARLSRRATAPVRRRLRQSGQRSPCPR
jgi:hypothetical protein